MTDPSLLVSYTIRPGAGSEAGVGWAFLEASLKRSDGQVHLVFDARDRAPVADELERSGRMGRVVLHPVPVPRPVLRASGDRRTRQSYLAWLPAARAMVRALAAQESLAAAHQVTFASAVLPPALVPHAARRVVWGPLSVPVSALGARSRPSRRSRAAVAAVQRIAAHNLAAADLIVSNNGHTQAFVERHGRSGVIEPNIVVERLDERAGRVDPVALVMAGHLVARKRPWLAVQALRDPRLRDLRLDVLGGGPLLPELRHLVDEHGLGERIRFLGSVPRARTLAIMSTSRLLVHPSSREGSPWVVGEAAAVGLASVVMPGSGSEATVELSANGGVIAPDRGAGREVDALVDGILLGLQRPQPAPSSRWSSARLPGLLDDWYREAGRSAAGQV
ncbi:glycosyltransferase [uncultured Amnibacterium sp.]|uniref:glycosyltransferase n=1 Tax=uncultured Amnibacterium sp. TaxID=1631851 RepID=UPI0035CA0A51